MPVIQRALKRSNSFPHRIKSAGAFTLIELLVVITIIAILAGLAFPAVQGALNSGRKAQARNDVQQIAAAIRAFELEYGRQPDNETSSDKWISDNSSVIKALLGEDTTLNPKGIRFLDVKKTPGTKGGVNDLSGIFYDPWGQPYFIKLNTDYDNKIDHYGTQFISVIVHSAGRDKAMASGDKIEGSDDIVNFK